VTGYRGDSGIILQLGCATTPFPLTLTLSLREREQQLLFGVLLALIDQTPACVLSRDCGPISLSPGERDGVRGNPVSRIARSNQYGGFLQPAQTTRDGHPLHAGLRDDGCVDTLSFVSARKSCARRSFSFSLPTWT